MTSTQLRTELSRSHRRHFLKSVGLACASATTALAISQTEAMVPNFLKPDSLLRIGVIGRTGHLNLVFNELENIPGARIEAYSFEDGEWEYHSDGSRGPDYDLEAQRAWVAKQKWGSSQPRLYRTYQEMLDREKLDLAVVAMPYARNAFAAAAAAEAGLHILSEKPVAVNIPDLEMVQSAVRRNKVRLSAMFALRYDKSFYTMRKAIQQGRIGQPCQGRAQKSYQFGSDRPWFYKHAEIFGSTILWVGIHAIDYLRWTMGREVIAVSGFQSNLGRPEYPGLQDNAVVSLELEGGATGAVTMDYLRPGKASSHGDDRLRVAGLQGIIERKELDGKVELVTDKEGPTSLELESPPSSLFADFVAELRGQGTHLIGPDEAFTVTRICIAATEAASRRTVVELT